MMDFEHEILTKKEVYELFKKFHNGDLLAREKLILSNLRLAFKISNTFKHEDSEYLKSLSIEALINAVDTFDKGSEYCFSTYASTCIKNMLINDYNRNKNKIKTNLYFDENPDSLMNDSGLIINIVDDILDKIEISEILEKLEQLPKEESNFIKKYYGISCIRSTEEELAKEFSVSKGAIKRRIKVFTRKLV